MKKHFILLFFTVFTFSLAKAQTDYLQWECSYAKAKTGQSDAFEKGITAHNKKYHTADPYKVHVFNVLTGPHSGEYFIALGPVTFTQIEGRPSSDEHGMDWAKNVVPYLEDEGETYYWRQDKDAKYESPNSDKFNLSRFRNFTILPGQRDRFEGLVKQVVAMYKGKQYPASYYVYFKYGAATGPHAITEINVDHWSYFDRPDTFEKDFEEINGAGSYQRFQDDFELCVDRSKSYDELVEFNPKLSSD